jgi:hypothetical protein
VRWGLPKRVDAALGLISVRREGSETTMTASATTIGAVVTALAVAASTIKIKIA